MIGFKTYSVVVIYVLNNLKNSYILCFYFDIYIYIYYLIGIYIFNYIKKYSQVTCHVLYEEDLSVK